MTKLNPKDRQLAKRIAEFAVTAGADAPAQVSVALNKILSDAPIAHRRAFVKAFLRFLDHEIRANTLVIEHAGLISEEAVRQVTAGFAAQSGKQFTVETRENAALLGGIRVTQGDNVYDSSVAGRLSKLATSVR